MKRIYFCFFILVIVMAGCFGFDESNVTVTVGDANDPTAPVVIFGFDGDLRADSVSGSVDTNRLVVFEPALKGKCLWINPHTLAFYASEPLPPATVFKVLFDKHIVGEGFTTKHPSSVTFNTPELSVTGTSAWYSAGASAANRIPVVELEFNYPVAPSMLKSSLLIEANGVKLPFTVIGQGAAKKHRLMLSGQFPDAEIQCELKEGAVSSIGGGATSGSQAVSVSFPVAGQLTVVKTETSFSASEGIVNVVMSEPVDGNTLAGNVEVVPFVLFRASASADGLTLRGNFVEGTNYRITIVRHVKSIFGSSASYDLETNADFGAPAPVVTFAETGAFYLGSGGNRNIGLYLRNTEAINVKVFRIYENNILHYLRKGKQWDWGEEDGTWYENYEYPLDEDYGTLIYNKKVPVNALASNGAVRLLNLGESIFRKEGDASGLYVIRAESEKKPWIRDVRLISFSDIGLLSMMNHDELLVQAFSISKAEPLEGVALSIISRNNQEIVKGQTGAEGLWVVKNFSQKAGTFQPAMITARTEKDFNCMVLSDNAVETSRFDAGGRFLPDGPYDAFTYGERNLYRPGDSVHFAVVVRDRQWKAPAALPLVLKVSDASGREFIVRQKKTGTNGEVALSFRVPPAAMTGSWKLLASSADGVLLNSMSFLVEEFQPDRMTVQLSSKKNRYTLSDKAEINIAAASLIGPPAANARYELEYRLTPLNQRPKGFEKYNFSLTSGSLPPVQTATSEGTTASDGTATEKFGFPSLNGTGLWRGSVIGTVFDENDRPVIRETGFVLVTQKAFVGVDNREYWISTGRPHPMRVTAVDADGKFLPDINLEIEIRRIAWETVIIKQNGQSHYQSQRHEIPMDSQQLLIRKNDQEWSFIPYVSGEYIVRFRVAGTDLWVEENLWAYGSESTTGSSFGVNREGEIILQADKDTYKPREKAGILLQTPFDGPVSVVIVQGNGSFSHQMVYAKNKAASVELPIGEEMKPNVFVTATLIRKPDNSDLPLTVAHGMINLNVIDDETRLPVTIQAADRSKSRTDQTVVVLTKPGATVTLASVDEGILQLTNYPTPDPWNWFYGRRAFTASWYDLYARLFPELSAQFSSSGGDGSVDMSRRVNPFGNRQSKPAVWWSGLKKAGPDGKCTLKVPLPAFSGKVRLMAVAFNGGAMGSAEKFMVVADPVVITAGLPAFLSPGDKLLFPVNLMNTTANPVTTTIRVKTGGPLKVMEGGSGTLTLQPNVQNRVMVSLSASEQLGEGSLTVTAASNGATYTETFTLSIRPAAGPVRESGSGILEGGKKIVVESQLSVLPGSVSSQMWFTRNPLGEFAPLLNDLIRYPYGCIEQTTSAAFPQLYLLNFGDGDAAFVGPEASYNVKEAITKISSMQRWDGGFTYWSGGTDINWWGSAYAIHFLVEARKSGFDVSNQTLEKALDWLYQQTTRYETESYGYFDNDNKVYRLVRARRETIYSLYVLSLAGRPNLPALNYYKEHTDLLTADSRVVLAAACQLAGDRSGFGQLMPGDKQMPVPVTTDGGSFYSAVSSVGWAMNALLTASPGDQSVAAYLDVLLTSMRSARWMSTFDKAQAMCVLARVYSKLAGSSATADIVTATGKGFSFDGNDLLISRKEQLFPATVSAKGTGKLYYSWVAEGIGTGEVESHDQILQVRRTLLDRNGNPLRGRVKPGELVVVRITLKAELPVTINNIAVSDLLPACFEIENPRLAPGRDYGWMTNRSEPDDIDVRHDRINFFTSVDQQPKYFYYLARVIAAGEFTSGATSAEAMYNGLYYSVSAGEKIVSEIK